MTDRIVIHRGSRVWEKGDPWAVLVDDIVVDRLEDSESVTIRVNDGQHYVRLESAFMRSDTYLIDSSTESVVEFQADTKLHGFRWLLFPVFVFKKGSLVLKPIRREVRRAHVERGFHWRAMPHPSRRLLMVHLAVTVAAVAAAVLRVIL